LWVVNDQVITQTVRGREQVIKQKMGMGYLYEVIAAKENRFDLKVSYYRMSLSQENDMMPSMNSEYDSASPNDETLSPIAIPFKAQLNKSFEISLDRKANIIEVRGTTEMIDAIVAEILEEMGEGAEGQLRASLEKSMSPENMKAAMGQFIVKLPDNPVSKGESWEENTSVYSMMRFNSEKKYSVSELTNKMITLSLEGELFTDDDAMMDLGAMQIPVGLGGTITGETELSLKTGFVNNSQQKMEILGELEMQGMTIPMSIVNETTISLEK
ncbi:MAG: DUF6263 family protein, partial [Bacteroidota bacterium]